MACGSATSGGAPGELGLQAVGSDHYFGLTYIGDTAKFKKLALKADAGIIMEEDAVGGSMFGRVNEAGATVNVLIGAKKFVEGWNSWRVSNMGLMNVGRAEGSEIIQLFGRGVRLKGRGMSLKRSTHLDGTHPDNVGVLETLNIFAVRADYMKKFREYLEREGLEAHDPVTLEVPVRANEDFLGRGLVVPAVPDGSDFETDANFTLDAGSVTNVRIDRATRASSWESGANEHATEGSTGHERAASELPLGLVDWEEAYLDLVEHRRVKGMRPMAVPRSDAIRSFVEDANVTVAADDHIFEPRAWHDREDLQAVVHTVLRKCADRCWGTARREWEAERMNYREVDEDDPNLLLNVDPAVAATPETPRQSHYVVSVPQKDIHLREQIEELIEQQALLYEQEHGALFRIHFDRHLYQPLLVENPNTPVTISPPPLNKSESRFVRHLRDFWRDHGATRYPDTEIFLLRNQGRGRGVGFSLGGSGFYPDFILWMITDDAQRVVFIEPHGMVHAKAYEEDEKARLHERLPGLAEGIARRSGVGGEVSLDSYIVSATAYGDLKAKYGDGRWSRKKFARRHILFPDDKGNYIQTLFTGGPKAIPSQRQPRTPENA